MPQHDPPYGGRIRVQQDGSVRWLIRERVFPSDRDADGTLEYAIRVVDENRNVFGSADGKCTVVVHPTLDNLQGRARFLIVSGYETAPAPAGAVFLGKAYFVTADRFGPEDVVDRDGPPVLPLFDLILRYDEYDLTYAGLPRDMDRAAVEVCYLAWSSARALLKLSPLPGFDAATAGEQPVAAGETLADRFGLSRQQIEALRAQLDQTGTDVWLADWRRVDEIGTLVPAIAGAQSIMVKGLTQPGSFALMVHSRQVHHAR